VSKTPQEYYIEVLTNPESLPEERRQELITAFADLSAQTTGGEDWRSYRPAIDGWRKYYNAPGAGPQDYDRLVLIYDGVGRLLQSGRDPDLESHAAAGGGCLATDGAVTHSAAGMGS
jgi:hypothetical protein